MKIYLAGSTECLAPQRLRFLEFNFEIFHHAEIRSQTAKAPLLLLHCNTAKHKSLLNDELPIFAFTHVLITNASSTAGNGNEHCVKSINIIEEPTKNSMYDS